MSDEIDIEEHDVMDNPSIKRIFPDLSVIKKEINQYYDEALNSPPETTLEDTSHEATITSDLKAEQHTHNMLNSIELVSASDLNVPEVTETLINSRYLHDNIIILGSKPNFECQKIGYNSIQKPEQEPKLILQNVSYFLNSCKRYCKECLILFPKINVFNLHMYKNHTIKNKGSTTPRNPKVMGRKLADKLYKCNTCDRSLSSKPHLVRHFKTLHDNTKKIKAVNTSNRNIVPKEVTKTNVTTGLACFHCKQLFPSQSSLIEHLYEVLEPRKIGSSNCSPTSISVKEINKIDNPNDRLTENEYFRNLDESKNIECKECTLEFHCLETFNQRYRNNHLNTKTNLNTDNCNSENILPRKNIATRESSNSVVEFTVNDEKKIKKKTQNEYTNGRMRQQTKKCDKCTEQFNSKWELEYHVMSVHRNNKRSIIKNKVKSKIKKLSMEHLENFKTPKKPLRSLFYKCFVCSKYNVTLKFYNRHLTTDHNIKEVTKLKKEPFDSQCKFCSSKMSDAKSYNAHLYKYHQMLLKKVFFPIKEQGVHRNPEKLKNEIQVALKSILYKCMKCDLFFLSSNAAMDHSKHLESLNNCECFVCKRVFKKADMALHVKQHSFCQTFTVHTLNESAFSRVLYKCSNCTVHYSEENFLLHYSKCDSETPNSLYCKFCDFLINRDDMDFHKLNHKNNKMQCFDFIIIESDIIDDRRISTNEVKPKKYILDRTEETSENLQDNSKLAMSFCHTCKCFICNINCTRKVHIEAKCGHMLKTVCIECGLVLTMKTHATHKEQHKKKQLSLQHYLFFDLKSKKQICPPIPDYPSCNICGVHFLRNFAIKIHSCHDQDYITCNICSIKLTEHAYKLHMPFHNYSIQTVNIKHKDTELELRPSTNDVSNEDPNSCVSDNSNFVDVTFFYTCKSCQVTVDTYEKVVLHCHDHYDCKKIQLDVQKCQNCSFMFDRSDYESHNKLHIHGRYNKEIITVVDFDPFYFRFKNSFWTKHIFAYVADEKIRKVLDASIYKYECRLKMEEIQAGTSSLILYKCDKCLVFIEPHSLYMHAGNSMDRSCVKLRKHPCTFCGLCFVSLTYRMAHEKEHEGGLDVNLKSYKIILFNKTEHETFNKIMYDARNQYILYQCRNCERVVDKFQRKLHNCEVNNLKICLVCGLLFNKQDYDLHFIRHEELDKFNAENIIVVMFGKMCYLRKKELRSNFSGTKYDYTIYKCKNCDLCLRTKMCTSKHVCVFNNSKCKCSKCGLYFPKQEFQHHSKLHERNLEFDEFNIYIIIFNTSSNALEVDPKEKLQENNDSLKQIEEIKEENNMFKENTKNCSEKLEKIYKCDCGLHFLEELNAQQHANNCNVRMKISKQSCFKCDLLFTPGELFNHLLKHHCDKKLQYKFDIVIVRKKENKTNKKI